MRCFDCGLADYVQPAVSVCGSCGVAVCLAYVQVGSQSIAHATGFVST
jgi:hypothetical protein